MKGIERKKKERGEEPYRSLSLSLPELAGNGEHSHAPLCGSALRLGFQVSLKAGLGREGEEDHFGGSPVARGGRTAKFPIGEAVAAVRKRGRRETRVKAEMGLLTEKSLFQFPLCFNRRPR